MEKIGFIGSCDKTDMIINIAKILVTLGKKVLVVDTTTSQKARYIVPTMTPAAAYITEFEQIDVAIGFNKIEQIKQYLYINQDNELPYDIMLIDLDHPAIIEQFEIKNAYRNYFVTSFDSYSLKRGLEIFSNLKEPMKLTKILFSQLILKEENDYLNFLSLGYKIIWDDDRIYFPMENGDLSVLYENQRVSKIKFKKLSTQYKDGLIYVASQILNEANDSQIRKVVKSIEKGV